MHYIKYIKSIYYSFNKLTYFANSSGYKVYLLSFASSLLILLNLASLYFITIILLNSEFNNVILKTLIINFGVIKLIIILSIIFIITNFANLITTIISQKIVKEYYLKILNNYTNSFLEKGLYNISLYKNVISFVQNDINRIIYIFLRFFILFNASIFQFFLLFLIIILFTDFNFYNLIILTIIIFFILLVLYFTKKKAKFYGDENSNKNVKRLDLFGEIFENASLVLTESLRSKYKKKIEEHNLTISQSEYYSSIYSNLAKPLIEGIFVTFVIIFFLTKVSNDLNNIKNIQNSLIIIFIILRILPSLYNIYQSLIFISSSIHSTKILESHINNYKSFKSTKGYIYQNTTNFIKFKNCKFVLGSKVKIQIKINATFKKGIHLLIGKNGSGKSTILSSVLYFAKPTKGSIYLNNINISLIDKDFLNSKIFYLNQKLQLINDTIKNNIFFSRKNSQLTTQVKKFLGTGLLRKLNQGTKVDLKKLSGGQIQKIRIISALLCKKDIIIFDEPTNHLDVYSKKIFFDLLKEFKNQIVIISTNDKDLIKEKYKKFNLIS